MDSDLADATGPQRIIGALHLLLETEAVELRRADFSELAARGLEKDRLMAQLELAPPVDATALDGLRDHARRNAALMMAALRGVRAARRRFEMLRRVQTSLNIYDSRGRRLDVAIDPASVERRA